MVARINVIGLKETNKYIKNISKEATKALPKILARVAIHVQGEVKMSVAGQKAEPKSVDTGRFLNSIGISVKDDEAKVFSDLDYAEVLEFGSSNRAPRRHFQNTSTREDTKIAEIFEREITKAVKRADNPTKGLTRSTIK